MNTQSKKERVGRIGQGVLEASRMRDSEIEEIVAAPHLFRSIKANIERQHGPDASGQRLFLRNWSWQLRLSASASLAIVIAIGIGISLYSKRPPIAPVPGVIPSEADVADSQRPDTRLQEISGEEQGDIDRPVIQQAAMTRPQVSHKYRTQEVEEVSEFYPITYTDDQDTNDGGQLVRVELPRSSIAAMGIDPPVENESPKVKTDLLIGSDGVMKAVRFVK